MYKAGQLNLPIAQNMLLIKNPHISSNFNETWSKGPTHEVHKNSMKIEDFLLIAYFGQRVNLVDPPCICVRSLETYKSHFR